MLVLSRECRGSAPAPAVILNPVKGAASKMDSDGLIGLHNTTPRPGASSQQGSGQDIVKLRQGLGKDRQGMALKAKGLKAETLA